MFIFLLGGKYDILDFREFQDQIQAEFGDIVRWDLLNVKNVSFNSNENKLNQILKIVIFIYL